MMRILNVASVLAALLSGACQVTILTPTPADLTPRFVTATLPPTRTPAMRNSETPPVTKTAGGAVAGPASCKDSAVLLQDVTIPDGTNVAYGAAFTKTWQFQNTGSCTWSGYTIAFASGDRLGAPDSAPVAETAPKSSVNVSVDLAAPGSDGVYTGFFELRNASGQPVAIGIEKTFWVKITVGNATLPTQSAPTSIPGTPAATLSSQRAPASCEFVTSGYYPGEIIQLINQARTGSGLAALSVNPQLTTAAQAHSVDMACHSLLSHTGSDASTIEQRFAAAGYGGTHAREMIYAGFGAYPQNAFDWWMNDPDHRAVIFDAQAQEIGAGYAYVESSAQGNYYTVDLGRP
jgi:uncharacterized protein YkwD